ncbi:MAG: hypothetical protein U1E29_15895, partial [Coriobacteriia bacterium]|nr:hypothetical protein [Coriobacteriia bacterium]
MNYPITIVFVYDNAKGWFLDVPGWRPGGGSRAIYTLATELAQDSAFDVRLLVPGAVPTHPVEGVQLVTTIRGPVKRG